MVAPPSQRDGPEVYLPVYRLRHETIYQAGVNRPSLLPITRQAATVPFRVGTADRRTILNGVRNGPIAYYACMNAIGLTVWSR